MYQIKLTPTAAKAFSKLHPDIKKQQREALNELRLNPYAGKQLREELSHLHSFKIKRYRVIYQLDVQQQYLIIVALGHRRDIYEVASRLLQEID